MGFEGQLHGQNILLNVTGGTGNTALSIEVVQGAEFVPTVAPLEASGIVFQNLFNGNTVGFLNENLNSSSTIGGDPFTVAFVWDFGTTSLSDLLIFSLADSWTVPNPVSVSTGTIATVNPHNMDFSSINASGTAILMNNTATVSSAPLTWAVVPEPSTYAVFAGALCFGIAILRRRYLQQPVAS